MGFRRTQGAPLLAGRPVPALGALLVSAALLVSGAVLGAGGALGAGPAAAAPPTPAAPAGAAADLRVTVTSPMVVVEVGGPAHPLAVVVTNDGPAAADGAVLSLRSPLSDSGVTMTTSVACTPVPPANLDCPLPVLPPGASVQVMATLAPPGPNALAPGAEVREDVDAAVRLGSPTATGPAAADPDARNDAAAVSVILRAGALASVPEVSGTVVDARNGTAAAGATVVVRDSAGHSASGETDAAGRFTVRSGPAGALVPGRLSVLVTKPGHSAGSTVVTGSGGRAVTGVELALAPDAPGGGTASPDAGAGSGPDGAGGGSRAVGGAPADGRAAGSAPGPPIGDVAEGAQDAGRGQTPWYAVTPFGDRGPVGLTLTTLLLATLLVGALLGLAIWVQRARDDRVAAWRRRFTPWRLREDHIDDLLR